MYNCLIIILSSLLLVGCSSDNSLSIAIYPQADHKLGEEEADLVILPQSGLEYTITQPPILTQDDFKHIYFAQVDLGKCILMDLTAYGRECLHEYLAQGDNKTIILMLNQEAVGVRKFVQSHIEGEGLFMFTEIPDSQLYKTVVTLNKNLYSAKNSFFL